MDFVGRPAAQTVRMGRHSSDERDEPDPSPSPSSSSAVADLRLLMHTRRLLLICTVVVVVIFAGYSGALVGMGRQRDWLLFLFIPLGLSGVCVGALLDRAHDRQHSS